MPKKTVTRTEAQEHANSNSGIIFNPTQNPNDPFSETAIHGKIVFVSGQIAINGSGISHLDKSVEVQTSIIMENIRTALEKANSGLDLILKATIYVTNIEDISVVNQVYCSYFDENRPARAAVAVTALVKGAKVEIDCIASLKSNDRAQ